MGIYDRDYYREESEPGLTLQAPQTVVVTLIVINVVLFLANGLFTPPEAAGEWGLITRTMAASSETLTKPWLWWQFLTYGFAHAGFAHILFNMLGLFFLGRAVEQFYGRAEFLRIYLVMLVLGSVGYAATNALLPDARPFILVGASGAVSGVIMLFIFNFPHQTLLLFPIPIPVKAWVLGVIIVGANVLGTLGGWGTTPRTDGGQGGTVATSVHLIGIAFAYLYFRNRWSLRWLGPGLVGFGRLRRPRLRVHRPGDDDPDQRLSAEVDRILEKIHREGEASLTRKERRTLKNASRQYQRRRDP
jgi:membrane associated rhomboid family serine protease